MACNEVDARYSRRSSRVGFHNDLAQNVRPFGLAARSDPFDIEPNPFLSVLSHVLFLF